VVGLRQDRWGAQYCILGVRAGTREGEGEKKGGWGRGWSRQGKRGGMGWKEGRTEGRREVRQGGNGKSCPTVISKSWCLLWLATSTN